MDLSAFDTRQKSHEGVDVPLVIDGETAYGSDGKPITFRVKGIADPEVRRLLMGSRNKVNRTPEEADEEDMKLMRAAVVGWSDNFTMNGEPLPFSRDAVAKVFAIPLVRQAIVVELLSHRNFTKGS